MHWISIKFQKYEITGTLKYPIGLPCNKCNPQFNLPRYVESNISRKSHTTIKYFLKLLASSCEAIIFLFLGVALVQYSHNFNIRFIAWCILFITVFRALAIVSLTWFANKFGRLEEVRLHIYISSGCPIGAFSKGWLFFRPLKIFFENSYKGSENAFIWSNFIPCTSTIKSVSR